MDRNLNNLLRWGIENSDTSTSDPTSKTDRSAQSSNLTPEIINALMGGPSDADRMRDAMAAVADPELDRANKLIAWDNFEQMVENIDNANNIEPLKLWGPLVKELGGEWDEGRMYAAWCVGTAVQNNVKAQESMLSHGAIPSLVKLAIDDPSLAVRKKAILALSSSVRNFHAGLVEALKTLPTEYRPADEIDAGDMEAIDTIIQRLREASAQKG